MVPAALRLLRYPVTEDRDSFVRGFLLALLLVAVLAGFGAKGSSTGF